MFGAYLVKKATGADIYAQVLGEYNEDAIDAFELAFGEAIESYDRNAETGRTEFSSRRITKNTPPSKTSENLAKTNNLQETLGQAIPTTSKNRADISSIPGALTELGVETSIQSFSGNVNNFLIGMAKLHDHLLNGTKYRNIGDPITPYHFVGFVKAFNIMESRGPSAYLKCTDPDGKDYELRLSNHHTKAGKFKKDGVENIMQTM